MAPKRKEHKGVTITVDRHGRERARFRLGGMDFYLPHPATPEYKKAYKEALEGIAPRKVRLMPRSIGDLFERFYASPRFNRASDDWKAIVRQTLEQFRNDARDMPVDCFTFAHIETALKRRSIKRKVGTRTVGGPSAAARLHEQLIRLFDYAVRLDWIERNPARKAELPVTLEVKGFHSWTSEEIVQYQERHLVGTKARLAMEIALWTGLRRGDIAKLGPKHINAGRVSLKAGKTGKAMDVQVAPDLLAAVDAMPEIGETFLQTAYGKPFSTDGLGNWFRDRCDEAGLPQCSIHGLRKALATLAADLGATQPQLKALGQWANDSEVATYTAAANQRKLADAAIDLVIEARTLSNLAKGVGQNNVDSLEKIT